MPERLPRGAVSGARSRTPLRDAVRVGGWSEACRQGAAVVVPHPPLSISGGRAGPPPANVGVTNYLRQSLNQALGIARMTVRSLSRANAVGFAMVYVEGCVVG